MKIGATADQSFREGAARYVELDLLTRWYSAAVVVVVAIIAPIAFAQHGPMFIAASIVPLAMQVVRVPISNPITLYRWAHAYALVIGLCVVVGSFETGGAQSPVLVFSLLVGQAATIAFPRRVVWNAFPVAIVALVVLWDWLDGGVTGSALMPTSVCIVAITTPLVVRKSLDLELDYRQRAVIDSLTGCLNRSSLRRRLTEIESASLVTGTSYSVIAIDVDHFKQINDRYSHEVGDQALVGVVAAIRLILRESDLLFRTGGEEFAVLAPQTTQSECVQLAERIRVAVAEANIISEPVTVSLGVAGGGSLSHDSALHTADRALYEAKRRGRNKVVAHSESPAQSTSPDAATDSLAVSSELVLRR